MSHHNFEELEVWKRASRLAVGVLTLVEPVKLYALRDQMVRSSISVPSNIAEGAERGSDRDFRRLLAISKGSCAELRTQLYIAQRAGVLPSEAIQPLIHESREISSMIEGLRKRLGGGGFLNLILSLFA